MIIVAVLTLFGFLFVVNVITSYITGADIRPHETANSYEFILAIIVTLAVVSGWRIFFWVMTEGPRKGVRIDVVWWVLASIGAAIAVVALSFWAVDYSAENELVKGYIPYLALRIYFLIPLGHLLWEVSRQRRANKTLQSDAAELRPLMSEDKDTAGKG